MAREQFNFTLARLKGLQPRSSTYLVHDSTTPGLQARVAPSGRVTLMIRRRPKGQSKVVTVKICTLADGFPVSYIRSRSLEVLAQLNQGINPNEVINGAGDQEKVATRTLQEAFDEYSAKKRNPKTNQPLTPRVLKKFRRALERQMPDWLDKPMVEITPKKLLQRYSEIVEKDGIQSARRTIGLIRAIWNFMNALDGTDDNEQPYGRPPLSSINRAYPNWKQISVTTRKIAITDLPAWMAAVRADTGNQGIAGVYLEMLLLTGMRRQELADLEWKHIDMKRERLHIPVTKNGKPLTLPITGRVRELLLTSRRLLPDADRPFPLATPRLAIERVTRKTGIAFSCHDLRRTFTTLADRSGTGVYAIKAILNHQGGRDVTALHYAQYDADDLREPLQRIEDYILETAQVEVVK